MVGDGSAQAYPGREIPNIVDTDGGDYSATPTKLKGVILNNYGAVGASEIELPTAAEGMNFIAVCGTAQDFSFDAAATDQIYLDGTGIGDGEKATMDCANVGEYMTCFTFQTGAGAYDWICECGEGTCSDGGA